MRFLIGDLVNFQRLPNLKCEFCATMMLSIHSDHQFILPIPNESHFSMLHVHYYDGANDYRDVIHVYAVGKIRKRWVKETLSSTGVDLLRAIKERVDPNNIFGAGNLLPD